MPRRGSELVSFLKEALYGHTYGDNLEWENEAAGIFCLRCIHAGNKKWEREGCKIFEDWKNKKKRRETGKNEFSEGRQRLLAAMNKCKLLRRLKKESTVSKKCYQFINGSIADSEGSSSEGVSDRDTSPEPDEIGMDGVETLLNDSEMSFGILDLFKFPSEILADMTGSNSDIKIPISAENAIDPNFLTDCIENMEDLGLQPVSSPGESEDCMQKKQETEFCSVAINPVENVVNFTENFSGDAAENKTFAMKNGVPSLDTISDALQKANNSELALPPVKLFRLGKYLVGIAEVPTL